MLTLVSRGAKILFIARAKTKGTEKTMTTVAQKIEAIKRTLRTMTRIANDLQTEDYEALDAMHRTIRDLAADLDELELLTDGQPSTEDELLAA